LVEESEWTASDDWTDEVWHYLACRKTKDEGEIEEEDREERDSANVGLPPSYFFIQNTDAILFRPRKLQSKDADLPEVLVPIRLEFDVDQHKFKESFLWNLNDPLVTPDQCAQSIVEDYKMGSQFISMISKAIAEQLSEYRASMAEDVVPTPNEKENGVLEDEDCSWWESWRKRLRTEKGYVKIGKDRSTRKRKSVKMLEWRKSPRKRRSRLQTMNYG
jgi:hypothetical protein